MNLTLHVPADLARPVTDAIAANQYACNVVHLPGACVRPEGDVVSCIAPREAVGRLLAELHHVGFDEQSGSITIDERLTVLSAEVAAAERAAAGAPDDALLWPVVRAGTQRASELSVAYLVFMVLATALAAIGLLTSSSVLIVGAMILGPEFGALAHLCVSALCRDARGIGMSLVQLVAGFGAAIASTALFAAALNGAGLVASTEAVRAFERAIVSPSWIGFIVACISGTAGVLTLTSSKGEVLIGVLVSVTTIPAAAEISLGLAFTESARVGDGAATLGLNLGGIALAGAATLLVYRLLQPATGRTVSS